MPNFRYWIEKQNNGRWRLMLGEKGHEIQRTGGLTATQAQEVMDLLTFIFDSVNKRAAEFVRSLYSIEEY